MSQSSKVDNLDDLTDEELMRVYQSGNSIAFEILYRRHSPKVFGFLRLKLGNGPIAEDVLQASFLKLHASRSHYDPSFSFLPWLFTICRSVLLDHLRKEARARHEYNSELIQNTPAFETPAACVEVDSLAPKQRQIIEMRYREDLSFEEIARRIQTSPANVRQIVSRALKILRGKS